MDDLTMAPGSLQERTGGPDWLRRRQRPEAPHRTGSGPEVYERALRWILIPGLAYRVVAAPGSIVGFLGQPGATRPQALLAVGVLVAAVLVNAVVVARVIWFSTPRILSRRWFLPADILLAVAINVAIAASLPPLTFDRSFGDVGWFYLQGSVAVCIAYGRTALAVLMVLLGFPVQAVMAGVNGYTLETISWAHLLARVLWLALAAVVALAVLPIYRRGGQRAIAEGLRLGREIERAEQLRSLHDSVLQTLEAIALDAGNAAGDPHGRLRAIQLAARQQARELRADLARVARPPVSPHLVEAVRRQAVQAAKAGLNVRLTTGDLDRTDPDVPAGQVAALAAALGEALANVWKHAGSRSVAVSLHRGEGRVSVVVQDRGRGFSDEDRNDRFGIRESIVGRMADAGGGADVTSRRGAGTQVTLWIPDPEAS